MKSVPRPCRSASLRALRAQRSCCPFEEFARNFDRVLLGSELERRSYVVADAIALDIQAAVIREVNCGTACGTARRLAQDLGPLRHQILLFP